MLDLVAEQEQPPSPGTQPSPQPLDRDEQILRGHLIQADADLRELLVGIHQGIGEVQVEFGRRLGALEVPENGKVALLFRRRRDVLYLLEQRRLADASGAEQPDAVARTVEDFRDLGRTTVESISPHPLTDDEGNPNRSRRIFQRGRTDLGGLSLDTRQQPIASFRQRFDRNEAIVTALAGDLLEGLPQLIHTATQRVFRNDHIGPHRIQELAARHHATGMLRKNGEHLHHPWLQADRTARTGDGPLPLVDGECGLLASVDTHTSPFNRLLHIADCRKWGVVSFS